MIKLRKGYRFQPTDEEMLFLLRYRAEPEGKSPSPMIIERDIYGENGTPWIIFKGDDPWQTVTEPGKVGKDTKLLYVITKLVKISKLRIVRTAGCGTWDGQTGKNDIKCGGKTIGFKKMFNFKANNEVDTYGRWIMHEYHLDGDFSRGVCNDFVICRIRWVCANNCAGAIRLSTSPEIDSVSEVEKTEGLNATFEGCEERKSDYGEVSEVEKTEAVSDKFQGLGKRESDSGEYPTGKRTCTTAITNEISYNEDFLGAVFDGLLTLDDIINGEGLLECNISPRFDHFERMEKCLKEEEEEYERRIMIDNGTEQRRMNANSYSTEFVQRSLEDKDERDCVTNKEFTPSDDSANKTTFDLDSFVASLLSEEFLQKWVCF